ncbi:MAG: hypothetical protein U9R74_18360 [Pseudomonadota bacterium]|nr:hypothetical protein [Pseudomonadota bacterium]
MPLSDYANTNPTYPFSVGQRSLDHQIKGAIWFDDLSIRSLRERNLALIEEYKASLVGPPEPNPTPPQAPRTNPDETQNP